jgi:hypothetical protein
MPLQCRTMLCRCVSNPSHSLAQLLVAPLRFSAALRDYANTLRCQTLPALLCSVLSSAMPELSCSLPKRNTAVHFPSEATQCLADADPFKADALPCQSLPTQVRSVLSRTMPFPCLSTLCQSFSLRRFAQAKLFIAIASPSHALPMPGQAVHNLCHATLIDATARRCIAFTMLCYS